MQETNKKKKKKKKKTAAQNKYSNWAKIWQ